MGAVGAKFDLVDVKKLAHDYLNGKLAMIQFNAPRRSTEQVIKVLLCSMDNANQIIAKGLLRLHDKDFSKRVLQWQEIYDEYGLENYEGHNWYVKFCIVDDGSKYIEEVSFHPLEKDMILPDGRILKVTSGS